MALAEGVGGDREHEAGDGAFPLHPHPVRSPRLGARGSQKQRRELAPAPAAPGRAVATTASSVGQFKETHASTGATELTVRSCSVLIAIINDFSIIRIPNQYCFL